MNNSTPRESRRVRFEEVAPTNTIVAYFNAQLPALVSDRNLPIFPGYDDLDNVQFAFVTLPSGHTIVVGQYENAPEIGVDLYVDLRDRNNVTAIAAIVVETCQYLAIPRSSVVWFHPDYEAEINRSYPATSEIARQSELLQSKELPPLYDYEPIGCFYHALEIYTRGKMPEYWAMLQHNLGLAYYHRSQGERWENLLKSVQCFKNSLEVFTQDEFSQKWQINQEDLNQSQQALQVEKQNLIIEIRTQPMNQRVLAVRHYSGAELSGANLSGANLSDADLSNADLSGANLSGANLISAELSGAELSGANLCGANLITANLITADLSGANLSNANLSGANLSNANLSVANLSNANVNQTQFGHNGGISELMKQDLKMRGAIFADFRDDRIETPTPVRR